MLMSTESPNHFAHLLQVLKQSPWSLILYMFFHVFPHVYSPGQGQGQTTYWGQNFDDNRKAFSLCPYVASFKTISSKSDFKHIFNDFIHVYSPGAKAYNPLGANFWCQQKALITLPICCKFKKRNLILYTFLMILYMYIAPGQGQTTPWGQTFDVNRKALSFWPFVASFKEITLKSRDLPPPCCVLEQDTLLPESTG